MKQPHSGEILRKKPTCEPWIVITIYTYGWLVADLSSTDDPVISKIILQRDFRNWVRDLDIEDEEIDLKRIYNGEEKKNTWSNLLV